MPFQDEGVSWRQASSVDENHQTERPAGSGRGHCHCGRKSRSKGRADIYGWIKKVRL